MSGTHRWSRPPATAVSTFFALCLLLLLPFLSSFGSREWLSLKFQADTQSRRLGTPTSGLSESSVAGSSGGHSSEDHHKSGAFNPIVFALVTYTISACAQQAQSILPGIMHHIPHTVLLFLIGMAMGAWEKHEAPGDEYREMIADFKLIDPHIVFWILLPTLLYEDAAGADWHVVKRVMPNSLILAFPGVMCNTVLTASILMAWSSATDTNRFGWDWEPAMLLGSILSATDPVAVVGALHALQAPAKLSSLISGESLFNDGTAVALFQIFWNLTAGREDWDLGWAIGKLVWMAVGGPVLGMAFAVVAYVWLSHAKKFNIEILICVVCIFGSFFVAEHPKVGVSGVLAVVTFGFYMSSTGKYAMDVEHEHNQHAVIEFLALLSNEAIFIIAGIVTFTFMHDGKLTGKDWLDLFFLYVVIHLTRTIVIILFYPLIKRLGYGLSWKEAVIVIFGGLRGAVGLALGLLVISDYMITPTVLRERIAFHTSGIVLLTLCINGTVVTHVYKALKIASPVRQEHHERLLNVGLKYADQEILKIAAQLKTHWFFFNTNFDVVKMLIPHLSEHVTDSHDMFGRRKMFHKTREHIQEAMTALGKSQASSRDAETSSLEPMHCRYMAKVRYYEKANKTNANVFVFSSSIYHELMTEAQEDTMHHMMNFAVYHIGKKRSDLAKSGDRSLAHDWERERRLRSKDKDMSELLNKVKIHSCVEIAINTSESKISGKTSGQERARQNWKIANNLGKAVCSVLQDLKKEEINFGEIQEEQMWKDEQNGTVEDELLSSRKVTPQRLIQQGDNSGGLWRLMMSPMAQVMTLTGHDLHKEKNDGEEKAFLEEMYQTVVNITRADYKAMYDAGTLGREPYQFLLESVANEEEAIHGDFKTWRLNQRLDVDHLSTTVAIREEQEERKKREEEQRGTKEAVETTVSQQTLESKARPSQSSQNFTPMEEIQKRKDVQRQSGFEVAYRYINDMLHRPRAEWKNFVYWLLNGSQSVVFEWFLLRRNIEVLLAYLFTMDHIQREVAAIPMMRDKCGKRLMLFNRKAKYDLLYHVFDLHPAMFVLYEHLLYAKIIIKYQKTLVHKLVEDGTITHEDAHHIMKDILNPSEQAIASYIPNLETLKSVYMQRAKKRLNTKNDWLILLMLRLSKGGRH